MGSRLFLWSVRSLVAVVLCLPLWLGYVYAEATDPTAEAEPPELIEVVATGMGIDANAALLNAYSNAVQQALGLYVDAETMVQNDQIVQDQILTYSKGFIETAQQISSSQANGLFQVKIRAKVKREELMAKAKSSNITSVKAIDGASIHAQKVSKEQQRQDVVPLLKKAILQFANTDMVRAELVAEASVAPGDAGNTVLTYQIVLSVDEAVYKNAVKELMAVLEQLAAEKAELVFSTNAASQGDRNKPDFKFKEGIKFANTNYTRLNILTWRARNFSSFKAMRYIFTNVKKGEFKDFIQPMPTLYLSLLDASGELLAISQVGSLSDFPINNEKLTLGTVRYYDDEGIFVIRPYVYQYHRDGGSIYDVNPKISFTVSIPISDEDLPLLKSAKIELKR